MNITKALQKTAYHEAGHAVTQWALDLGIKEVTIVPSEEKGEAGYSIHKSEFNESCMDLGEETVHQRWAVVRLAGHWAQVKWDPEIGDEGCGDDYRYAADHIEQLCYSKEDEENHAWWLVLKYRTKALIINYWPEIEAFATQLLQRGTIIEDEAEKIIRECLNARKGQKLQ